MFEIIINLNGKFLIFLPYDYNLKTFDSDSTYIDFFYIITIRKTFSVTSLMVPATPFLLTDNGY